MVAGYNHRTAHDDRPLLRKDFRQVFKTRLGLIQRASASQVTNGGWLESTRGLYRNFPFGGFLGKPGYRAGKSRTARDDSLNSVTPGNDL